MTGDHLLQNPTEMNAQSRNLCFPLKMIMGKETKETIKEFAPMFKFMEDCESNDPLLNQMTANYGMMPLTCAANCNLSAGWKYKFFSHRLGWLFAISFVCFFS